MCRARMRAYWSVKTAGREADDDANRFVFVEMASSGPIPVVAEINNEDTIIVAIVVQCNLRFALISLVVS